MAKVLLLNGSPHANGCTARALREMMDVFQAEGIETELVHVGNQSIRGCMACNYCQEHGKCVFNDTVNEVAQKLAVADGLVVGSPVYYASPNGTVLSLMDRLMYSAPCSKHMKVGAAVVSARRGGSTATFDALNKYFASTGMVIAPSTYWNQVHGFTAEDVEKDAEGLQTMRNLARNMAFLIRAIADAAATRSLPAVETEAFTCFHDGK
jgi:multimeric flavodoxin WrbA